MRSAVVDILKCLLFSRSARARVDLVLEHERQVPLHQLALPAGHSDVSVYLGQFKEPLKPVAEISTGHDIPFPVSDARRSRIAELRRIKDEADAEIRRLARELADEFAAEMAEATGMRGEKRDAFMTGLPPREQDATDVNNMFTSHPLATSAGRGKGDPMIKAANKAGHTLRSLAEAVGMSPAALSMARRGTRSIRAQAASKIESLIGFKASAAHWPGGIQDA